MISMTLLCFLWLFAVTTVLPLCADALPQGRDKSPPSLKVERAPALPPSNIRKRFDRQKNITYVDIDVPLPQREQSEPVTAGQRVSTGEISLSFRLEYKGASASELAAVHLTISFTGSEKLAEGQTSGREVEVRADAYRYTYQSVVSKTEPLPENAARPAPPPGGESVTVELPLEDLQQVAYANRVDIKVGKKELRVRSIQLGDLRKTLIAQNAN